MSKKPAKPKQKKPPAAKTVVMLGLDKDRKPHAARFMGENEALLAKAAACMGFRLAVPATRKHLEIVSKLPPGRIHATGNGVVPPVQEQLYDQVNSLIGGEPGPISASLAQVFDAARARASRHRTNDCRRWMVARNRHQAERRFPDAEVARLP